MKILIIGIVASGKTTLAKRLSKELNYNYYEIDSIVHDDINKRKRTPKEQEKILNKICKNKNWIIEGTLRTNLYNILNKSDQIIYLDIPLKIRKKRIFIRYIKQKLKIEKCNYKPSIKLLKMMYKWTATFEQEKENFEKLINNCDKPVTILKNIEEVNSFKINPNI